MEPESVPDEFASVRILKFHGGFNVSLPASRNGNGDALRQIAAHGSALLFALLFFGWFSHDY